jgi:putative NADH-flavin reductase
MRVAVVGATRGIGAALVGQARAAGHAVTAVGRSTASSDDPGVTVVRGSITDGAVAARAVEGADAVAWTVGDISEFGPAFLRRRVTLYSEGTRVLIAAMGRAGVRRLVVVTGVGAGDSRRSGGWLDAWVLLPLLRGAIYADKDRQEALVRASGADWTILRPGFLTDGPATGTSSALIDLAGVRAGRISRGEVARVMLACLTEGRHLREVVLLTG